ncbi:MAG: cytochrome c [Rhodobacteraceae bacterium]|nr:MAG: cytochrome c [Paracoccaceae bacterium]
MAVKRTLASVVLGAVLALPAFADEDPAIAARQGQFKLFAHNFGVVGGMAQGRMDYDAEMAQTAADNLFHLTRVDQGRLWPEGTDSASSEGTRANADIWDNLDDFVSKFVDLQNAVEDLQGVAGSGLDEVRASVMAVGGTCQACHEDYRDEES